MGLFGNLFKKKEKLLEPADLGSLGVDVHSHFIPGIDDGAKTIEDSLELIAAMQSLGYKKVITTPHVMSDFYRNTPEIILGGLEDVRKALKKHNIDMEIDAAAEYNLDADFIPKIEAGEILTFGDNYVLFELPFIAEPPNITSAVFELQTAGYKPILAHAERYPYWFPEYHKITDLRERGVKIQLNINSLTGFYGPEVKATAEKMIEDGVVDLLGSDCHHTGHIALLQDARRKPSLHKALELPNLINREL